MLPQELDLQGCKAALVFYASRLLLRRRLELPNRHRQVVRGC